MLRLGFSPYFSGAVVLIIGFSSLLRADDTFNADRTKVGPNPNILLDARVPGFGLTSVHQGQLQNVTLSSIIQQINAQRFTAVQRQSLISSVIRVIEGMNPHLFIQRNFLKVNPISLLKTFSTYANSVSNFDFHLKMREIFNSMQDGHTVYLPPEIMVNSFATLGFIINSYFEKPGGRQIFIFARPFGTFNFEHPSLKAGVQILSIDGEAVEKLAARLGALAAVGNKAAQLREGIFLLTTRLLAFDPIPSRQVATIRYISTNGIRLTIDVPWNYFQQITPQVPMSMMDGTQPLLPVVNFRLAREPKKNLDSVLKQSTRNQNTFNESLFMRQGKSLVPSFLTDHYEALSLATDGGNFGYLVVKDFSAPVTTRALNGLANILRALPQDGLILDVRGNPGGRLANVVYLFELLSSQLLRPIPDVIRATSLSLEFTEKTIRDDLRTLQPATEDAVMFGEPFSGPSGNLLSGSGDKLRARFVNQVYTGPIVTLADAASASGGDLIVSFSRDYNMSFVINVDGTTAGAGATILSYNALQLMAPKVFTDTFPFSISFTTAFIRLYRALRKSGALIEYKGVEPDDRYYYTRDDILNGGIDLILYSISKLRSMK